MSTTYTVKDIATMLHTEPETVRRWIRSGKLEAEKEMNSKKEGRVVTEKMLQSFLKNSPKYAGLAATSAAAALVTGGTAIATSVIAGAIIQGQYNKKSIENAKISAKELLILLKQEKREVTDKIAKNEKTIAELQRKMDQHHKRLVELDDLISQIKESEENE